jgi:hypothetical protein
MHSKLQFQSPGFAEISPVSVYRCTAVQPSQQLGLVSLPVSPAASAAVRVGPLQLLTAASSDRQNARVYELPDALGKGVAREAHHIVEVPL